MDFAGFELIESDAVPDDALLLVGSHLDENNTLVIDAAKIAGVSVERTEPAEDAT